MTTNLDLQINAWRETDEGRRATLARLRRKVAAHLMEHTDLRAGSFALSGVPEDVCEARGGLTVSCFDGEVARWSVVVDGHQGLDDLDTEEEIAVLGWLLGVAT